MGLSQKRPNLANGGSRLPFAEDGMCSFAPPRTFSACRAVTPGGARGGAISDLKEIVMKLHVNRGRASARQVKWISVDSGGDDSHLL